VIHKKHKSNKQFNNKIKRRRHSKRKIHTVRPRVSIPRPQSSDLNVQLEIQTNIRTIKAIMNVQTQTDITFASRLYK
jgi:hypothetical protein